MKMFKFLVVAIVFCAITMAESSEKFSAKFDSLGMNEILDSHKTVVEFCKCLLGEGHCKPLCEAVKRTYS